MEENKTRRNDRKRRRKREPSSEPIQTKKISLNVFGDQSDFDAAMIDVFGKSVLDRFEEP